MVNRFPGLHGLAVIYEDHAVGCTKCGLAAERKNIVFGTGQPETPLIAFVGEAPGAEEDETGYPFVGQAGKLLSKMVGAMGLSREEQTYILNTVLCRPPKNRAPLPEELAACEPRMVSQLRMVRPKTIVCLGTTAAHALLKTKTPVGKLRGLWHEWEGIPVRVTYHPAYLLRDPKQKLPAWEDLKTVLEKLGLPVPNP